MSETRDAATQRTVAEAAEDGKQPASRRLALRLFGATIALVLIAGALMLLSAKAREDRIDGLVRDVGALSSQVRALGGTPVVSSPGAAGAAGAAGATGATGAKGDTGQRGPAGARGQTGDTGARGATGARGPRGEQGATGATGPAGAAGADGQPGATGAKGDTGDRGERGDKGDRGDPGPACPDGYHQDDAVLSDGRQARVCVADGSTPTSNPPILPAP